MPQSVPTSDHGEKHEVKRCPRCGRDFVCKVSRFVHCDCTTVPLPPATLDLIRGRYDDCLCVACLWHFHGQSGKGLE